MIINYAQFAGKFTHLTADEERWLLHALRDVSVQLAGDKNEETIKKLIADEPWRNKNDPYLAPNFQYYFDYDEENKNCLHIYSKAYGNPWAAGQLARAFLKTFRPTAIWAISWSPTIDKLRNDEFSGGAIVATAKEIRALNIAGWIQHMMKYFNRTGKLPPKRKVKHYKQNKFKGPNKSYRENK
jgi:hypothetical protein